MWKVFTVFLVLAAGLVIGLYCSLVAASRADDLMKEQWRNRYYPIRRESIATVYEYLVGCDVEFF